MPSNQEQSNDMINDPKPRKAKGPNGGGTIIVNKDRASLYEAQFKPEGKPRLSRSFKTKKAANNWLTEMKAQQLKGQVVIPTKQTVRTYVESWLDTIARPRIRPRTYASYVQVLQSHVIPSLGAVKLSTLTPAQVRALVNEKLDAGLSTTTVRNVLRVLKASLTDAVRDGLIPSNPMDRVDMPRATSSAIRALSVDQSLRFLDATKDEPYEGLFVLALTTGLRKEELFGLQWEAVDLEAGYLVVRRCLFWFMDRTMNPARWHWSWGQPKSKQGNRRVTLTGQAVEALRNHRERQKALRAFVGDRWEDHGLVFTNGLGRPVEPSNFHVRHFKPLLKKADVPDIRFHDLRHSTASLLLHDGVHPKVVQELLGHANISITLDLYSHSAPTLQTAAVKGLEKLLSR